MEKQESSKGMTRRSAVKALAVSPVALLMLAGCSKGDSGANSAVSASSAGQSSAISAGSASVSEAGKAKSKAEYELELVDAKVFRGTKQFSQSDPVDLLLITFDMKNVSERDLYSFSPQYDLDAYQNGVKLRMSSDYESVGMTSEDFHGVQFAPGYIQKAYALYELRDGTTPVELKNGSGLPTVVFEKTINVA